MDATATSAAGLSADELQAHGLLLTGDVGLIGTLQYERPAMIFGARRVKGCSLGAFTYINGHQSSSLYACDVGRYCSIGEDVVLGAPEHPLDWLSTHPFAFTRPQNLPNFYLLPEFSRLAPAANSTGPTFEEPIRTRIGHDVWVGAGSFIKRGLHIGDGAVISADAVVTHDVEPYMIVAGVPARPLRRRFREAKVERLLALRWWHYDLAPHKEQINFSKIDVALEQLEQLKADEALQPLTPLAYRVTAVELGFDIEPLSQPLY